MNDYQLTWYMQELAMHGFGAEIDFTNLIQSLDNPATRQTRYVWFHLTSFLAHSAMISKIVSPIRPEGLKKDRMNLLREKLKINNNSDVLPRDARDNVEHFDERIDNWVKNDNSTILEIVLDDRVGYNCLRANEKSVKRIILQKELIFISEKQDGSKFELELQPLFNEVNRISDEAEMWIKNDSPYSFIYPQ